MIDIDSIAEIIATYEKHGWVLRRVLVSAALKAKLRGTDVIKSVKIKDSRIDAAWFSRPPKSGGVAWEIRYLGDPPFALLENIDEGSAEFEESLQAIEARLWQFVAAKISA